MKCRLVATCILTIANVVTKIIMRRNNFHLLISALFFFLIFFQSCKETPYAQGKILYENFCESCHMADGSGLETLIPPLVNSDFLEHHQSEIPCIIRKGQIGEITVNGKKYNQEMTAIPQLSDFEINNVMNYINSAWGNDYGYSKITDVQEALKECPYYE